MKGGAGPAGAAGETTQPEGEELTLSGSLSYLF
jgi:hypothetical protein